MRDKNRGKADVYVDVTNATSTPIDPYSATTQARQVVFRKGGLDPSRSHALEVRALGTKNASSSNTPIDADAFVVVG